MARQGWAAGTGPCSLTGAGADMGSGGFRAADSRNCCFSDNSCMSCYFSSFEFELLTILYFGIGFSSYVVPEISVNAGNDYLSYWFLL